MRTAGLAWPWCRRKTDGLPGRRLFMLPFMIYQDPLAYLLGLEGIALLDAWAGDHDRTFTDARLAEIRRLLDDEKLRDRPFRRVPVEARASGHRRR